MAVYVDRMAVAYRGMMMCHMVANTREELLVMADTIGIDRKWIQRPYTAKEHFDICLTKRRLACRAGAISIDRAALVRLIKSKK